MRSLNSAPASLSPAEPGPPIFSPVLVLRCAACAVLLSQAWIHFLWDAPFRALLWNQDLLEPWVERILDLSWEDYAATSDAGIATLIRSFGVFYAFCAVLTWTVRPGCRLQMTLLVVGSAGLAFLAYLKFLDHNREAPQLIEHTAQWAAPLILVATLATRWPPARTPIPTPTSALETAIKIAIALAFTGHGLYAAGIYPVPGNFIFMTMQSLGLSEEGARVFLRIAGLMDFAVAAGIFFPRVSTFFLSYAFVWGALTSLARVVSHLTPAEDFYGIDPWLAETLTRAPHALLPFALLANRLRRPKKSASEAFPPTGEESIP